MRHSFLEAPTVLLLQNRVGDVAWEVVYCSIPAILPLQENFNLETIPKPITHNFESQGAVKLWKCNSMDLAVDFSF